MKKESGIGLIASERQRQITDEEWAAEHDDEHYRGELAIVGALYAVDGLKGVMVLADCEKTKKIRYSADLGEDVAEFSGVDAYPAQWSNDWDKRGKGTRIRRLAKAGALIAAEIDRLLRKNSTGRNQ